MTFDYPITPLPFHAVRFDDAFWAPRLETNRAATLPCNLQKCEETGRIANFARAAGWEKGPHQGIFFNDSDVFKVLEGAAYSLRLVADQKLDAYLDDIIAKIAAAQEKDGYLYTIRTIDPHAVPDRVGKTRWANLKVSHELYNVGHLYEAAVAHVQATGKRTLLDVALKNADLIARTFGPNGIRDVPGHQEIEIGLVKLYRHTGQRRFLDLAKFFLDERGRANGRTLGEDAHLRQNHLPVTSQTEAVGHAVRAGYMYCGMADVAALTGDAEYIRAIDRLWDNVVTKKMYLTGGIGSRHEHEVFGDAYELPNDTAYCETCAAIAHAMWNHRMFLLHGDAKYLDVMERVLYNGFLSGVSFDGSAFFYPNPLSSDGIWAFNKGTSVRQPWFHCACCPTNIVRFLPSLPGYVYAQRKNAVYVNLFVGSKATLTVNGQTVTLIQETRYPRDGQVRLKVQTDAPVTFDLHVRIPGWAQGQPVPGDLYTCAVAAFTSVALALNGQSIPRQMHNGFAHIHRPWHNGDEIVLDLPMPVQRIQCSHRVENNRHRIAIERGPLVFCAEAVDNGPGVRDRVLADNADLAFGEGECSPVLSGGSWRLIPYYAWCHRGANEMAVWLKRGDRGSDNGR